MIAAKMFWPAWTVSAPASLAAPPSFEGSFFASSVSVWVMSYLLLSSRNSSFPSAQSSKSLM